jgi:hypothetical protein
MSNAVVYAALIGGAEAAPNLKQRLGKTIGPRETSAAPVDRDIP